MPSYKTILSQSLFTMIMGIVFDITWMHSFNEIEGWSAHAQDNLNFIMSMLYAAHIVAV